MIDNFGRDINYLRISITDRCNMRCRYCMPYDVPKMQHEDILKYEEYLRICRAAASLGINCFKITGGEPFVRKGALHFITALKSMENVKNVTVTTNGYFLEEALPQLEAAHIDGVNISMDTLEPEQFKYITGVDGCRTVLSAVKTCAAYGIHTKVNTVMLRENEDQLLPIARLAEHFPVDVRFIELMPIGFGRNYSGITADEALKCLKNEYPDLHLVHEKRGNGPAAYFKSDSLRGYIGLIAANTHRFCASCNRMRLTSTGLLKPCLCYEKGIELEPILHSGHRVDAKLTEAFQKAVAMKPSGHCFADTDKITEYKSMNQIGG